MSYSSIFSKSNFIKAVNLPGFKEYKKGIVFKNSIFPHSHAIEFSGHSSDVILSDYNTDPYEGCLCSGVVGDDQFSYELFCRNAEIVGYNGTRDLQENQNTSGSYIKFPIELFGTGVLNITPFPQVVTSVGDTNEIQATLATSFLDTINGPNQDIIFNFSGTPTVNGIIDFLLEINGDFCNIRVEIKDTGSP
jgi:hypothetical protein